MKRSALLLAVVVSLVACGPIESGDSTITVGETTTAAVATTTPSSSTTTTTVSGFPAIVEADNGSVTVESRPEAIISLSATATEMLFSVGAGDQVIAVDDQSNYPEAAPTTDLSSFTPNVEAILSHDPDLVIIAYDPGDLIAGLGSAGVPVLSYNAAFTLDDTYRQIEAIGKATGHAEEATLVNEQIASGLVMIVGETPDLRVGTSYYHEVDNTFFSATSSTFIGQIYGLFGLENIADAADEDGSAFGYPQLSSEYIVSADPDLIFLSNTLYGESAEKVAARPGWDVLIAVQQDNIVELDSDVVSRWGPRVIDFAQSVSDALQTYMSSAS